AERVRPALRCASWLTLEVVSIRPSAMEELMDKPKDSLAMPLVRVLGSLLLSAVCGCAGARVVREARDGGVIAVPMNNNCWPMYYRNRAENLMSEICPDGYQIDREEFVWDGKPGPEGHRAHESYFGYTDPDDENAPYLRKEYWIAFHAAQPGNRKPAADAPPKPGQAAPSAPPSSPAEEDKEQLPAPRPLKGVQE
ncbi:MAG: hypothetical protein ACRELG_02795, partial [Gemmataceae bacterium]